MLPPSVDRFLRSLRSVWELELLLLVHAQGAQVWKADELVRDLRASVLIVTDALAAPQRMNLIEKGAGDSYRYAPASAELKQLVHEIAASYASSPAAVINAILSTPIATSASLPMRSS